MENFLVKLKSKNFQNRKVAILENGSWAPSAAKTIKGYLEKFKNIDLVENVVTIKSSVKEEDLDKIDQLVSELV